MLSAAIRVRPRYHRWLVDPPTESLETNTGYAFLEWSIPLAQAAVVLVDVWDRHYLLDTAERAEHIIQTKIRPLLAGCRKAGLQLIHAPSPRQELIDRMRSQRRIHPDAAPQGEEVVVATGEELLEGLP